MHQFFLYYDVQFFVYPILLLSGTLKSKNQASDMAGSLLFDVQVRTVYWRKITLTNKADGYTINFVQSSDRGAATKSNNLVKGNAAEGIQVPGPSENICRTVAEGQRRAIMNQKMFSGYFCESWQPYHDSFFISVREDSCFMSA